MTSDRETKSRETVVSPVDAARRRFLRLALPAAAGLALGLGLPRLALAETWLPPRGGEGGGKLTPPRKPRAPRVLMIDPGHGGYDPGALGRHGLQEKTVTLDVAQRLAEALAGVPEIDVRLTREKDEFLPLQERVKIGQKAGADLFVSVHADSAPNSAARGLSAYTLSEKASDAFASQLAERENHADVVGGLDLSEADQEVAAILFDLTARRTRNTAQRVKVSFVHGMARNWRLLEHPMRAANFAVLRSPDVPAMLIETGFLSNPEDEALLSQPRQRQKIAQLMAKEMAVLLKSSLFG